MKKKSIILIILGINLLIISGCSSTSNELNEIINIEDNQSVSVQNVETNTPIPLLPTEISTTKENSKMILTSEAFEEGQPIPPRYACHGENISPSLTWDNAPENTKNFVLVMDDPDAIPVAGYVWDHWLIYNIPKDVTLLNENISSELQLEDGSTQGMTSFNRVGYGGPCPPAGQVHTYIFTLYALDKQLNLPAQIDKEELLETINDNVISEAVLTGTYP